jgi:hypothetical protein
MSAMRRSKKQKPPTLYLATSSRETSPSCASVLSDWDADDEGFMSSTDFLPSRPLSVAIPSGPYYPRRPTLQEVLANSAPTPWTLSAFTAYLSQNHCLETLEFTMDASRYKKHYSELLQDSPDIPISSESCEYVKMLWQKLIDAYIAPNGPREVNLPSDVRDRLMALPFSPFPPLPAELDPAVKIIYELMEESVLVPFLNSVASLRGSESCTTPWTSTDDLATMRRSYDERSASPAQARTGRDRSPPSTQEVSSPQSGSTSRQSHHSHLSAALGRSTGARLSAYLSHHPSGSSGSETQEATLTDDTASSPSNSALEPMTPPTTPPTSDVGFQRISPGTSPKNSRGENGWKKMSARLGWKKSKSGHGPSSSTSGKKYTSEREAVDGYDSA